MKNFIKTCSALLFCLGMTLQLSAQNIGINTDGAVPDNSAVLDISSNDKGLLIPRMDSTSRINIVSSAKGLMVYDSTYNQFYSFDGMLWSVVGGSAGSDNLGNHTASQNLQLNNNWLNNDGGDYEGIIIDSTGNVGIGTDPLTNLHVSMGGNASLEIDFLAWNNVDIDVCQTFTATKTMDLHSIRMFVLGSTFPVTYSLYQGNTLVAGPFNQADPRDPYLFSGVTLNAGVVYTFEISNPNDVFYGIFINTSPGFGYLQGQACHSPLSDFAFQVYESIPEPGFRIDSNLVQINNYFLPTADGTAGQILSTDGAGNVNWANVTTTDNQNLSLSTNILSLTNDTTPVDLSIYLDNFDEQDLSISGDTLSLTNDTTSVVLSGYWDNTDEQDLSLSGDTLHLTNDTTSVVLSGYLDNTDEQDLSLTGDVLSLSNDTTDIDLSDYLDNTDAQDLSFSGNSLNLTSTATPSNIDLSPYLQADNLGNHIATQNLQLNNHWLNNDGDANEGLFVDDMGRVGVNTSPNANFHVNMGTGQGFQIDSTGMSINNYKLPPTLGNTDQILATNGAGDLSWTTIPISGGSPDDLGNHTANQNLALGSNWLSNDGDNEGIAFNITGKVGIGRHTGAFGHPMLEYYGANISLDGPHVQYVGTTDDYPLFQQLNWTHDNLALIFDAYYDGLWRSSSATSNFSIYKAGGFLYQFYSSGNAQGTDFSWSTGTALDMWGRFGIGKTPAVNRLEVDGDASKSTAGDWLANSDARLKKNIRPLSSEEMLNKLLSLQGVTYEWEDNKTGYHRPEGIQYGFTAQNIQDVFPSLVTEDNHGYLQTAYGTYDAMTVEAIRALNDKIENVESHKTKLQSKLNQLQSNYDQLDNHTTELAELKRTFAELENRVEEIQFLTTETTTVNEE